ncbi:hypothetical protein P154DRAFT_582028 [Amniculicola lignicola CBS 123094]|uniref:Uncharacterized protein n=1 Tax=Amniculicola lignicola CBS 123094 TaxID=1392246 RepID=A0A6A5VZR1_9PLEO|nr:hypothetical protein P154DRAFT_582028 [Amniculicola lignicola CBS 123094]
MRSPMKITASKQDQARDKIGLFPDFWSFSKLEKETLIFQKYRRKGVYDSLPGSASEYEKAIAICADDVLFKGFQELRHRFQEGGATHTKQTVEQVIHQLSNELHVALKRRAWMKTAEAARRGFVQAISRIIQIHSDELFRLDHSDFPLVLRLQILLGDLLALWLSPFKKPQAPAALDFLDSFTHLGRAWMVETKIEDPRSKVLRDVSLGVDDLEFLRCFQGFLEMGLDSNMPTLAYGDRAKKEMNFVEYNKATALKCKTNCNCLLDNLKEQSTTVTMRRKPSDPEIMEEKRKIKAWFQRMDQLHPQKENELQAPPDTSTPLH